EQNGSSKCLPCKEDEYIEYPNDFPRCLGCRTCREDQVELSPCRAISDTQCACRNGTFCSPDHPCEMCQKCRPRCPKGEVELAPCTPHSDRRCGPPTGTFSSSSNNWIVIATAVPLALLVLLLCFWRQLAPARCHPKARRRWVSWRGAAIPCPYGLRREGEGLQPPCYWGPGTAFVLGLGGRYRMLSFQVMVPGAPSVRARRSLVPVQGKDPVILLRRSFDIFARDVPYKDWKRFGRALDLLENDIVLAEMNDKYSLEPFFQMLNTWQNREGMNASVNTLLETLHQINLGGIAEDISAKLVQQGSFQYEVC
ncbi:TR10B factor, partial [Steatornis caripensis]|nr:TR10B factor [Steatornis caripensis]